MKSVMRARGILWLLGEFMLLAAVPATADEPLAQQFKEELLAELEAAPQQAAGRWRGLVSLFRQAGAPADAIRLLPVTTPTGEELRIPNVEVTLPGDSDRYIIIGAHLDKVAKGQGVVDDWSGIVVLTNLYQEMRDRQYRPHHNLVFVGFAYEEDGLLGSRSYVAAYVPRHDKIIAMVNLECFGVGDPLIWTNGSDDSLESLALDTARKSRLPLGGHHLTGVSADSVPFTQQGIPAITIDGLPETHFDVIHSDQDTFNAVDPEAFFNAYRLLYEYVVAIDSEPSTAETGEFAAGNANYPPFHPEVARPGIPAQFSESPAGVLAEISRYSRQWEQAFNQGHPGALAALYAPDAVILPDRNHHLIGTAAIRRYYFDFLRGAFQPRNAELRSDEIDIRGDTAYEYGQYQVTLDVDGQKTVDQGNTFVVWKRSADGVWRMYYDAWYGKGQ